MPSTMQLHFEEYGQGPPLIILHGLFGSLDNWKPMSRKLGGHFHVFALDQRNHGRSPHSSEMNYPLMADDLAGFMQANGLSSGHVLGHSMGGKTAMQFALRYPACVDKLVVVDISPGAYPPLHRCILDALSSLDLASFQNRSQMDAALAPSIPESALRQFLLKNVVREPGGVFRWRINLPGICGNYDRLGAALPADGASFDRPALFLRGEESDYLRDQDIALVRQLFLQAQLRAIPRAGHWVHVHAPEAFLRAVVEFLASSHPR